MNFSDALNVLKAGGCIRRDGWNGAGMWLELQKPDANSKMTLPYIFLSYPVGSKAYPEGARVPWLASQTDLLAEDWVDIDSIGQPLPDVPKVYTWHDVDRHETSMELLTGMMLYRARMTDGKVFSGRVNDYHDRFTVESHHDQILDDINRQATEEYAAR